MAHRSSRSSRNTTAASAPADPNAMDIDPKPQLNSPLLQLPRELRERIYIYVLAFDQPICWPNVHKHSIAPTCPTSSAVTTAALLRTSRAVYEETAPLLYTLNRFVFCHPSDANMFRHTMDNKHARMIGSLLLRIRDSDLQLWTSYLGSTLPYRSLQADFPALKTLVIHYRSGFWLTPTAAAIAANNVAAVHAAAAAAAAAVGTTPGAGGVLDNYLRWHRDPGIESLCLSVYGRTMASVRVVVMHRVPRENITTLIDSYPRELFRRPGPIGEASTEYRRMFSVLVRLELHPSGSPAA